MTQIHVSSEDGLLFEVSFNTNEITFKLLELTRPQIETLISDIKCEVYLLEHEYEKDRKKRNPR